MKTQTNSDKKKKRRLIIAYLLYLVLLLISLFFLFFFRYPLARQPRAIFTYSPSKPILNMDVTFDASYSYDPDGWIMSYQWDFGDGTVAMETNPILHHVYSELGTYTVTLVVTDNDNLTDLTSETLNVRKYPVASFTYSPTIIHKDETVTFDASSSTPNGGRIISYKWDFGDGTTATLTEAITTHIYMKIGTHEVRLTVTDDEGLQNTTSKMIEVIIGVVIDVYTQHSYPYGGQGLNVASDAFAPQQEVLLFAKVTYNEEPLYNKLVSFEVYSPNNLFTILRTAVTSEKGIAMTSFIIPWQFEDSISKIFGTWVAKASVEAIGQKAKDTLSFQVGWIIELFTVEPVDSEGNVKTNFGKEETAYFKLYAKNIAFVNKNVTVTVTVMDELNVPIGYTIMNDLSLPPNVTILFADLEIPKWAFTGVASAHANAFTDPPEEGGTAYCPEITATFTIGVPTPPPPPPPPPPSWIIEFSKIEPCDQAGNAKTNFTRGETAYFKVYVKNNAFEEKTVTISVVLMDVLNFPIGQITLHDLVFSPGTTTLVIDIMISDQAFVGVGIVHVNAFTDSLEEGGLPYCPEMTATFYIESNP